MKTKLKILHVAGLVLPAFLIGCATPSFRPYLGQQQDWPMSPGGIVNTQYALPALTCLPSEPYAVLGELKLRGGLHGQPAEECLPRLTKMAREMGADALLVVDGQKFFAAAALRSAQSPETNAPLHAKEVATPVYTHGYGGYRYGYGGYGGYTVMSFDPNVVILAIRWTGEPPAGLPKRGEATKLR
jgi:hypothetical protein